MVIIIMLRFLLEEVVCAHKVSVLPFSSYTHKSATCNLYKKTFFIKTFSASFCLFGERE